MSTGPIRGRLVWRQLERYRGFPGRSCDACGNKLNEHPWSHEGQSYCRGCWFDVSRQIGASLKADNPFVQWLFEKRSDDPDDDFGEVERVRLMDIEAGWRVAQAYGHAYRKREYASGFELVWRNPKSEVKAARAERIRQLLERGGLTQSEMAALAGVAKATISVHRRGGRKAAQDMSRKRKQLYYEIGEALKRGASSNQIAKDLGCAASTVRTYIKKHGAGTCGCGRPSTHLGMCSTRNALSPKRQAYFKRLIHQNGRFAGVAEATI